MPKLSPAAQAVADATEILVHKGFSGRQVAAAALRAAANRVVPQCDQPLYADDFAHGAWFARDDVRDDLLRIADELEAL